MSVMHGFRRNQRRLARGVLALFCLVWLQLAAAPCRALHMAPADAFGHGAHAGLASTQAGQHEDGRADVAGHDECGGMQAGGLDSPSTAAGADGAGPCPWCPTHEAGVDGGRCAYPHGPQVDSRLPTLFLPPPVAEPYPVAIPGAAYVAPAVGERFEHVPRLSFAVSYCRYLE